MKDEDDDALLFRESMHGVKRIEPQDRVPPFRKKPRPVPQQHLRNDVFVREEVLILDDENAELETGDVLYFSRAGLQHGLLRKLRRGQYPIGAELDLHGMTANEARQALSYFLGECRSTATRCVRIIHGKGLSSPQRQPVLKTRLNGWLQRRDEVLAFCSARPADGGTGAVYVLLRLADTARS
ncbi:MAG: Smr/MutS family protein [Chromatiales bacterium]|jgi:DNA-nicking Smr family endonuclease|nr:Smr/MutS family protein [Chromatiales bacterium]